MKRVLLVIGVLLISLVFTANEKNVNQVFAQNNTELTNLSKVKELTGKAKEVYNKYGINLSELVLSYEDLDKIDLYKHKGMLKV